MTTIQQVELGVLGPLHVRQFGLSVAIPGAKPRAMLTMLGLHAGTVVPADTLIELLWGDEPPRTAAKALQTHVSALRRALGDGFVVTRGTGWILTSGDVDAARYRVAAAQARDAMNAGVPIDAVARFDEAMALWRGGPELPDGRRGQSERTRWIEEHAALVEDRADALLATGRAAELIGELEAAIADAPLRERRWGHLMLALYRSGRQAEALAAFQRARTLLADELGIDPGQHLRRLEAAVVAQDASLEVPAAQHHSSVTRTVTFLLTDIEGSTAAWERNAEAMAAALARHDEIVEQVVTFRGGRLVKTRGEGDATFSVFDRPSAAAAAAIELQEAMRQEPWAPADPIAVRVALHTGEVEFRDGDYFGRAVNRAARLRSVAAGGEIFCSGATAELVIDALPDDVVLDDLGTRQLKNLARPERVFQLRLLDAVDGDAAADVDHAPMERPALPAVLAGRGPFVGRSSELESLVSGWALTLTAGARAVLIAGEPGVGKTRLAGEWSQRAYGQGVVVLYGRCDEDLGAPYQPFTEALRSLVPCMGADRLRGLRGIEPLLPLVPALGEALPELSAPTGADPDTERYALFDAVVAVLAAASASAPVVLVLDDLHWAAKPTLLLLRHLLRFGEHARVQVLGTYRSTDLDRSHPLAAMLADLNRDGSADRLQLAGLGEEEVTTYVAAAGYDDEELARALASVTGGNPFFLIEALRHVDESGGRWDPSTLPQGVREAVSRRLSRLSEGTNKALGAAAVVGSRFAIDLVERVVEDDLVDAFEEARKAGIVIEEPGGRYRFNHALVRQSLLAELASVRRQRLHQRIAVALESQSESSGGDELLAELAYHYFECAWAGNAAKAVDYCRRAADQAMARLAYEGAADLYDKALHALEELDDDLPDRQDVQGELLIARCEALLAAGDVASATSAVAQLRRAAGDSGQLAAWGACFDGELAILVDPERLDEVEPLLSAAAEELAALGDAAGEAKAHTVRATCLGRLGRVADCEMALDQALTAARRAHEHRRVNAVLANAPLAALWGPNSVPRAGGRCLDVVRLLRITTGSPIVEATSTRCQGVLDAFRGRAGAGRQLIGSARRSLAELGMRHALLEVEQFAGIVELVADEAAAAEEHLRRAYHGFRRMGLEADTAETAALLARTCLALARYDEADELCLESERLAGHALKASISWRTVRAQLLARAGARAEARRVAEEAVALAERTDALVDHGDACLALATVLGAAGDTAGAGAAAGRALELYERKGAVALADKARALLAGAATTVPASAPRQEVDVEEPTAEPENGCTLAIRQLDIAGASGSWDEVVRMFAPAVSVESRRRIVGLSRVDLSPEEWIAQARQFQQAGVARIERVAVAVRGDRLALFHSGLGTADDSPGAAQDQLLHLMGLEGDGRIALHMSFDVEDIADALTELDSRYLAGEAADHERTWVQVRSAYATLVRRELPEAAPNWVSVDHRTVTPMEAGDYPAYVRASWDLMADVTVYVESVHRLEDGAALLTHVTRGVARDGFGASWRFLGLLVFDHDAVSRCELFDEHDLDAALRRFDDLIRPKPLLDNAASHAYDRFQECFAARDWEAVTDLLADDNCSDDRRRVAGAGIRRGRDAAIEDLRGVAAQFTTMHMTSTTVATRGDRLAACYVHFSGTGEKSDVSQWGMLGVVEVDGSGRIAASVTFDEDDLDGAVAELDARFMDGEAAPYAEVWRATTGVYDAFNRGQLPAVTPDCVSLDHRRGVAFAPGGLSEYLKAAWEDSPGTRILIEAVHHIGEIGAVVTHSATGASRDGFVAEWRDIALGTYDSGRLSRTELFDETDRDAALARFDELSRTVRRLANGATDLGQRFLACFEARDWDAMSLLLGDDFVLEDRRRGVNLGIRRGRTTQIADMRATVEVGFASIVDSVIATRGDRLALTRVRAASGAQLPVEFDAYTLGVIEVDESGRISAIVVFDADDGDAAWSELESRYLAGEAADHARAWAALMDVTKASSRRDLTAYREATWQDTPGGETYVEAVHRLSDVGAVVTHVRNGTSDRQFETEWRMITVTVLDGDLITRSELFDEDDVDSAIARFDEFDRRKPLLQNTASRTCARFRAAFAARDWTAVAATMADDLWNEDHRSVVNAGIRRGRQSVLDDLQAAADIGVPFFTATEIAIRGDHLVLTTDGAPYDDRPEAYRVDTLLVTETDAHGRIAAVVLFDSTDLDAALAELDRRYLGGEAAPHGRVWTAVVEAFEAISRHELPATSDDFVDVDHRPVERIGSGDPFTYLSVANDGMADSRIYVERVHRLTQRGVVVTHAATGTTDEGLVAEWRLIDVLIVDGDLISRCEIFDEDDLENALARFGELNRPMPLENAASRAARRFAAFGTGDWQALTEILADDFTQDDRRRVVGAGVRRGRSAELEDLRALVGVGLTNVDFTIVAVRGERLVLSRSTVWGGDSRRVGVNIEMLTLTELDADGRIAMLVMFDADDLPAAIAELDARYLVGEAAAHSRAWTAVAQAYTAVSRHQKPNWASDFESIDHRKAISFASGDLAAYVEATWNDTPGVEVYVEAVHRLSDLGVLVTHVTAGTSAHEFEAEWRMITLTVLDGDLIIRSELFDEDDLEGALVRFDELSRPASRSANAATRLLERFWTAFERRDWDALAQLVTDDTIADDRRKVVGSIVLEGRRANIDHYRALASVGARRVGTTVLATRGEWLAVGLFSFSGDDGDADAFHAEAIAVVEVNEADQIMARVLFDADDVDAAYAELESRYVAGEAAPYARTWSAIVAANATFNRKEPPPTTPDWVSVDHRSVIRFEPGELMDYIHATWDMAPQVANHIVAVHALNDRGAVWSQALQPTSEHGFEAEWREISLGTIDGDRLSRIEAFDETALTEALACFDELCSANALLDNAATHVNCDFVDVVNRRSVPDYLALCAADARFEDRRRGLYSAGPMDAVFAESLVLGGYESWRVAGEPVAVRGNRLALIHYRYRDRADAECPAVIEALGLLEVGDDGLLAYFVLFDANDRDAAFGELTERWIASGEVAHPNVIRAADRAVAIMNRQDWDGLASVFTGATYVNHRQLGDEGDGTATDFMTSVRAIAALVPDLHTELSEVLRYSEDALLVRTTVRGTSTDGTPVEIPIDAIDQFDGDRVIRIEMFDPNQRHVALARFDELF